MTFVEVRECDTVSIIVKNARNSDDRPLDITTKISDKLLARSSFTFGDKYTPIFVETRTNHVREQWNKMFRKITISIGSKMFGEYSSPNFVKKTVVHETMNSRNPCGKLRRCIKTSCGDDKMNMRIPIKLCAESMNYGNESRHTVKMLFEDNKKCLISSCRKDVERFFVV